MKPTPYIGYSNDTLDRLPSVRPGDSITCPTCNTSHELKAADDGSETILFYRCGEESFLGAISGRCVVGTKADVSGSL